jgi:hypothetical protein
VRAEHEEVEILSDDKVLAPLITSLLFPYSKTCQNPEALG